MKKLLTLYKQRKIQDSALTLAGSIFEYSLLLILNLLLARILSVEDFGIVRATTAYFVVLQMVGHLTIHDLIAARVAQASMKDVQQKQIRSGIFLVIVASVVVVLVAEGIFYWIPQDKFMWSLQWLVLLVPISSVYLVFFSMMPAYGGYRSFFKLRLFSGISQRVLISYLSKVFLLSGWIAGRFLSTAALVALAVGLCAPFLKAGPIKWQECRDHLRFGLVQSPAAMMWMLFLNIDIIVLTRVSDDFGVVGVYGFAALLVRSLAFIFNAAGAAAFRDLAQAWLDPPAMLKVHGRFLIATASLGLIVAVAAWLGGLGLIAYAFGERFAAARPILLVLCLSIPLNALCIGFSLINISGQKPLRSVVISAAALFSSGITIVPLIQCLGPVGAAWSMLFGNASAVVVGAIQTLPSLHRRTSCFQSPNDKRDPIG